MKINKKNAARLASLTAVGAGVFAISPTAAEANILYTPENITLTPLTTPGSSFATITVTNAFKLGFGAFKSASGGSLFVDVKAGAGTLMGTWTYAGVSWSTIRAGKTKTLRLGSASTSIYALFKFKPPAASHSDYGWVQLADTQSPSQLSLHIFRVGVTTRPAQRLQPAQA